MIKFEQDTPNKNNNKYIPLSATLIAGVLLALSPKEHVHANKTEDNNFEIEIKNLSEKYHSLLNKINQKEDEQDSELSRELSVEEIKAIQEQLILFIEKEGDIALSDELKKEVLTLDELEELFSGLLEAPAIENELEEIDEAESVEVDEVDEQESIEVEKIVPDKAPDKVKKNKGTVNQPAPVSVKITTEKSVSYTVRAGDTLSKIAREHNVTVSHIVKLNNIKNINLIRIGQVLTIHGNKVENAPADDLENLGQPMSKNEFIEFLGAHASIAAKEQNLYASVMIAQAALESGFGTSGLSSAPNHNLYGMKGSYQGESVIMRTREYSTEKGWYYVNAHFKKYPSYLESLLDHSAYIRRGTSWAPAYYSGVWRENTTSYRDATSWLQGRYATDPAYASKLNKIIETYNLTRFDMVSGDDVVVQPERPESDVGPSTGDKVEDNMVANPEASIYQVKKGDTLSHIAQAHKMSIRELKEFNNLTSDLIFIGQKLKVKKNVVEVKPTPEKPSESDSTSYTVKRGDTLSQIARVYKMSVRELKELNNLRSDLILVGQRLNVKRVTTGSNTTSVQTYQIKAGDTLSHLARKFNTTVSSLKEKNKLKSDLIYVNQLLKI